MTELQFFYSRGYRVAHLTHLRRHQFEYSHTLGVWVKYENTPQGVRGRIAYIEAGELAYASATDDSHPFTALRNMHQRLTTRPNDVVSKALRYGYDYRDIQKYLDAGYQYEYGVFVRRERLTAFDFRVKLVFLDAQDKIRETFARANRPEKALQRAYRYRYFILEHGSLRAAWQICFEDTPHQSAPSYIQPALAFA